jgi:hypothetical protein
VLCHSSVLFLVADQFKFKLTSDSKKKMDGVTLIDCVFFWLCYSSSVIFHAILLGEAWHFILIQKVALSSRA